MFLQVELFHQILILCLIVTPDGVVVNLVRNSKESWKSDRSSIEGLFIRSWDNYRNWCERFEKRKCPYLSSTLYLDIEPRIKKVAGWTTRGKKRVEEDKKRKNDEIKGTKEAETNRRIEGGEEQVKLFKIECSNFECNSIWFKDGPAHLNEWKKHTKKKRKRAFCGSCVETYNKHIAICSK